MHRVAVAVGAGEDDDADADRHQALGCRGRTDRGRRAGDRLDRVRLDERVRQQLAGQPLDDGAGGGLVGRIDGQLDAPPDADGADAADAEVVEAALDGPALRIEDARLGRDVDGEPVGAHRAMTSSAR